MTSRSQSVLLGFAVGTGEPVEVPLAHTFVSGQTQQSGKTTTLRAIVERSGRRALAFVTKRGEDLEGQPIRPYLPRRSAQPIHWRLVEAMLASALDQKRLQSIERLWLIKAAKGAHSLDDVQRNIRALLARTKSDRSVDIYTLLDEYLELVVPQLRDLDATDVLELQPGLNVMDLTGLATQTQSMVIRAALERINTHETNVLTVLPEAWEFAPRGRQAPAKDEAINMARKGAAPKVQTFLLVDSQDIAGVDNVLRQACSVWLIGVQRELNEIKRAVQMMPVGVKRPKADDVATLQLGQFYACWGAHAVKVYVQPAGMDPAIATAVARGEWAARDAMTTIRTIQRGVVKAMSARALIQEEEQVNAAEAKAIKEENATLRSENEDLRQRIARLESRETDRATARQDEPTAGKGHDQGRSSGLRSGSAATTNANARDEAAARGWSLETETLYRSFKARLMEDAHADPTVLSLVLNRPELQVRILRQTIDVSEDSTRGMVAKLIVDGFFERGQSSAATLRELQRRGRSLSPGTLYPELDRLAAIGFFRIEDGKDDRGRPRKEYHLVEGMRVNVLEV